MDIPEPPEHIRKAFRRTLLEGDDFAMLAANRAQQQFDDLRRYALAMERLIDEQEQAEIEALEPEASRFSEEDRGEFWAWHYPVYWEQVVRTLFRASTITAIVSFLETTLNQICKDVRLVTEEVLNPKELHGGAIERSKRYLVRFGGFSKSGDELWRQVNDVVEIRNALVHANGDIDACRNPNRIRDAMSRSPGLREEMASVVIEKEYLSHALESIGSFLSYLSTEMRDLCLRRKQFEAKERS